MKKAIFLFAFLLVAGIAGAQSCGASASAGTKSCCAGKMAKAAAADASIEKRMADDGSVSYVRKETDAQGNVKFVSVQFDEAKNTFVNVAPKTMTADEKEGMVKKSCTAGEKKACCASDKAAGKACCAGKAKAGCSEKVEQ